MFHSVSPAFGGLYRYIIAPREDESIDPEALAADINEGLSMSWQELQETELDQFEPIRKALPNATKVKLVVDLEEGDMYIAADDDNGAHATPYLDLDEEHIGSHYDSFSNITHSQELDDEDNLLSPEKTQAFNIAYKKLFKEHLKAGVHGTVTQIADSVNFAIKQEVEN